MYLTELGVRQGVFVKIILVLVLVVGSYCFAKLPRYLDPDVILNFANVVVPYRGASPEDVETSVTIPLEEELKELDGILKLQSISRDGVSVVVMEYDLSITDMSKPMQDLFQQLDQVTTLPPEAEEPIATDIDTAFWPICQVVLAGPMSEHSLDRLADDLSDEIERIPGVGSVGIFGEREREIWVEVDRSRMESHGLSLPEIAMAIRRQNANVPGGEVDVGPTAFGVRVLGEIDKPSQLADLVLSVGTDGGEVRVSDVAVVRDTFEEARIQARLNGTRAIVMNVPRKKGADTIEIIDHVREILEGYQLRTGPALETAVINDTSLEIRDRLRILSSNAMVGMALVFLILALFLGPRNAAFAFLGIPVSFMITFILMKVFGLSIDGISLFSMILVLGIVVDDAIIILENVHRHIESGKSKVRAAIDGAAEVTRPVIASTLTTVAAFGPLLLVSGLMGRFIREIPQVIIFALSASLFEAFFMLPSHIVEYGRDSKTIHRAGMPTRLARRLHTHLLSKVVRRRYLLVPLMVVLIGIAGSFLLPTIQVEMFPPSDAFPRFDILAWLPVGTRLEETDAKFRELSDIVRETLPSNELEGIVSLAGHIEIMYNTERADHLGTVTVMLKRTPERQREIEAIIEELRPKLTRVAGINDLRLERVFEGPPTGAPVHLEIQGAEFAELERMSEEVQAYLRTIDGVYDVKDDYNRSRRELRVRVDESRAKLLGVDSADVALALRGAFDGIDASIYHAAEEEVEVRVLYQEQDRSTIEDVLDLRVKTARGGMVPLKSLADVTMEPGPFTIHRVDGKRTVTVTANVVRAKLTSSDVNALVQERIPGFLIGHAGYYIRFGGEFEKTQEAFESIFACFGLAVLLIYLVLATQFKSFIQPFIIMSTVPLASIGVVVGLLVMQDRFTFPVMIGVVALAGVVVNDALVLIDFINRYRIRGFGRIRSVLIAGRMRVRPILLTTVTTVVGLLPMALGVTGRSPVWEPLATSMVWGLSFATVLTLFVIPVVYLIIDDIAGWFRRRLGLREPHELSAESGMRDLG